MSSRLNAVNAIINDPKYADYLAIVKGARNGFVYGVKIRFPHAVVMAILFGRGDWASRVRAILRATRTHAVNLASFVALYKSMMLLQRKLNNGKSRKFDTFFSGLIGGYLVFGDRNAINEQVVLYVVSRVVATIIPRAYPLPSSGAASTVVRPIPPSSTHFSVFAAVAWGAVMYLFAEKGHTIQPGMFNSMTYLYKDSDHWDGLRTLLLYNT
ncbi:peroxisomal membrane protein 4 [Serendipita vermifera]|nr:peroxisomal membrane protein 4 [Serendipita vermifera]